MKRLQSKALVFIIIFLISYFTFKNIFNYGICCDDILAAFNTTAYGITFKSLFSPYGGQSWAVHILYILFGLESQYYFIANFIARLLATITVYFLALAFSKNKTISFTTSILFAIGYAGVGTAEYAHQTNIYISLSFLNLGFINLISYYKKEIKNIKTKNFLRFLPTLVFFFLSLATATVRVNGIVFYYLLIEIGLLLIGKNKLKRMLVRIATFFIMIIVLRQLGSFGGNSPYHLAMINDGLKSTFGSVNSTLEAIYYNTSVYFDIISPPLIDRIFVEILTKANFIQLINNGLFIVILGAPLFYFNSKISKKLNNSLVLFLISIFWLAYLIGFRLTFETTLASFSKSVLPTDQSTYIFQSLNALGGGLLIILTLDLLTALLILKKKFLAFGLFLTFAWTESFLFITYLFSPRTFAFSTFLSYPLKFQESYVHYYFIPALGAYFLITYTLLHIIPSLTKNNLVKPLAIGFLTLLIVINIFSVKQWISGRMFIRSQNVLSNAFTTINNEIIESYIKNKRPIVYFTSIDDGENYYPYVINEWGFSQYRYGLVNGNYQVYPLFINEPFSNFQKDLENPQFSFDHGITPKVSINDIYAFKIENGTVISQTSEIRKKLLTKNTHK